MFDTKNIIAFRVCSSLGSRCRRCAHRCDRTHPLSSLMMRVQRHTSRAKVRSAYLQKTHNCNRYAEEQSPGRSGQVLVHTDAANKEDAEVEVVLVEHPHSRAKRQPQFPEQMAQMVVEEERQGQGQVREEHRAAGPAPQGGGRAGWGEARGAGRMTAWRRARSPVPWLQNASSGGWMVTAAEVQLVYNAHLELVLQCNIKDKNCP